MTTRKQWLLPEDAELIDKWLNARLREISADMAHRASKRVIECTTQEAVEAILNEEAARACAQLDELQADLDRRLDELAFP